MVGADTGFFFSLREGHPEALRVFEEEDVAVSVLTRFELRRLALRRGIPWAALEPLLSRSVHVVELTADIADEAAALSHGTGLPALDALILASLVAVGCRTVYTRDEHFLRLGRKDVAVVRL